MTIQVIKILNANAMADRVDLLLHDLCLSDGAKELMVTYHGLPSDPCLMRHYHAKHPASLFLQVGGNHPE